MRHLIHLFSLAFLLCFLCAPASAQNSKRIKKLQQQSTALKRQIADSEKLLHTTKRDVKTQLNNLAVINSQILEQQKLVDGYQAEVTSLQGNITTLRGQLDSLQADLAACKHKYRKTVLYMNRNRLLQNRWTFILMSKNFRQMYRRMRYASEYTKYLRAQAEIIRRKQEAVTAKSNELHAAKRDKDVLLGDARSQHRQLQGQKTQRQVMVDELNKKQSSLQATIAQQRKKQQNLNAQIDRLIQQEIAAAEARRKRAEAARKAAEARRKREAEAKAKAEAARQERERRAAEAAERNKKAAKGNAARSSASSSASSRRSRTNVSRNETPRTETTRTATPRYEAEDAVDRTVSSGFRANKGRLPIPITGSYAVTSRYGQYNVEGLSGVTLDSKGINLTGQRGAQARCVYNGEVSAVANIGGGYIVIVRHGDYYSVYSNLSSVSVRNGQSVSTRQTLGTVASDGSGNATLHFQLRQRQGASAGHINPLPWLAR